MKFAAVVLALLACLVGCADEGPVEGQGTAPSASPPVPPPAPTTVRPVGLRIPSIGVSSSTPWVPLGKVSKEDAKKHKFTKEGDLESPDVSQPQTLGWYCPPVTGRPDACGWPAAGEPIPAGQVRRPFVVAGHINSAGTPGVFSKLAKVKAGDKVEVSRSDGQVAVFKVIRLDIVKKTVFPVSVYDATAKPTAVIITCGPYEIDRKAHRYEDQTIAVAELVELKPKAA